MCQRFEHQIIFHHKYHILSDCICNTDCPNGCSGCPHPICVCGENPSPQNEKNLQECMKEKSIDLGQCILDCNGDQSCEESCVSLFKYQYDQCPCQVYMETSFSYGPDGLGPRLWVYRLDPTLLYF